MVAVRCAACGETIRKGRPIKLAGTEVFHPECVGELAGSRTHRLARRTLEQKSTIDRLQHELDVAREGLRRAERHADGLEQRARLSENELAGARRLLGIAQGLKESDDYVIRRLERERDAAIAATTQARNELALLRTLAQPAPQPTVVRAAAAAVEPEQATEPAESGGDDSAARFKLLELT